ncbi:hypothetical protein C8J56DRAFT_333014 [Mycena floridula]|nr:hypothetical protein C8J56DRAFT_333014 [Mycena floridula]
MGRGESARPTNRTERLQDEYRLYRTGAEAGVLPCFTSFLNLVVRFFLTSFYAFFVRSLTRSLPGLLPKPLDKNVEWLVGVLPLDSASELGGGEDDQPRSLALRSLRLDDRQLWHPALEALCCGGSGVRNVSFRWNKINASDAVAFCFAKLDLFTWIPI